MPLQYKVLKVKPAGFEDTCNEYARAGWKFVSVTSRVGVHGETVDWYLFFEGFFFERPVATDPAEPAEPAEPADPA